MNRTALALALVTVAAVLPWPSAQAITNDCVQQAVDKIQGALDQLNSPHNLSQTSCLPATLDCQHLVAYLTAAVEKDPCDLGGVGQCPAGQVGVTSGDFEACINKQPEVPQVGLCPKGEVGVSTSLYTSCLEYGIAPPNGGNDPSCENYDDDWGFGGGDADCHYACVAGDALQIDGEADDHSATAGGTTSCGGAKADCESAGVKYKCEGAGGPTTSSQHDIDCHGTSDEVWDNGVYVHCQSVSRTLLCKVHKEFCEPQVLSAMRAACGPYASSDGDLVDRVLEGAGIDGLRAIVVQHATAEATRTLTFIQSPTGPSCEASFSS
jgi:hypothetical protein